MGNRTIPLKTVTAPRPTERSTKRSTQQKPEQKSRTKHSGFRFLLHFAQRHPFICLFAVWSSFLYVGWLAMTGLTHISQAPLEVVQSPQSAEPQSASSFELSKPGNAFGLLAIVTASCAVTSVLIARQLHPVKSAPRRALKRQPAPETIRSSRRPRTSSANLSANLPTNVKPVAQPRFAPRSEVISPKVLSRLPIVAVAEDENPLDMGDAPLADFLDIRQQRRP